MRRIKWKVTHTAELAVSLYLAYVKQPVGRRHFCRLPLQEPYMKVSRHTAHAILSSKILTLNRLSKNEPDSFSIEFRFPPQTFFASGFKILIPNRVERIGVLFDFDVPNNRNVA